MGQIDEKHKRRKEELIWNKKDERMMIKWGWGIDKGNHGIQ